MVIMDSHSPVEITLHLDRGEYFFVAPDLDPLHQKAIYEPGVDTVFTKVRAGRLRDAVRLTLFLPPDQITPGLELRLKESMKDYCLYQVNQFQQSLNMQRRLGRRTLWVGLTILVIALILSGLGGYIMENATSKFMIGLGGFMFNGFMIIGWVSLWTPTSMLLFDWWPDAVSKRTYEKMAEMPVVIRSENPDNLPGRSH
jgi:hypothetical protein